MISKFTDLIAWKEAHKFLLVIYKESRNFPPDERFGLTNQIRRATVSISSNIAEGFGRGTTKDKQYFYIIAKSSLAEVENQIIISRDLGYIASDICQTIFLQAKVVDKLVSGLIKSAHKVER